MFFSEFLGAIEKNREKIANKCNWDRQSNHAQYSISSRIIYLFIFQNAHWLGRHLVRDTAWRSGTLFFLHNENRYLQCVYCTAERFESVQYRRHTVIIQLFYFSLYMPMVTDYCRSNRCPAIRIARAL